jgi:hypothetical protein
MPDTGARLFRILPEMDTRCPKGGGFTSAGLQYPCIDLIDPTISL